MIADRQTFRKELEKALQNGGSPINCGGLLRFEKSGEPFRMGAIYCPITLVAKANFGLFYTTDDWELAAKAIGLNFDLACDIIEQADETRRELELGERSRVFMEWLLSENTAKEK